MAYQGRRAAWIAYRASESSELEVTHCGCLGGVAWAAAGREGVVDGR